MTRSTGVRDPRGSRPREIRETHDPYGIGPVADRLAPVLSVAGLLVVAWVTLSLLGGNLPTFPGQQGPNGQGGPGGRTAAPSGVIVVPTDQPVVVPGSFVYVKGGNVWVQSGASARQLTSAGGASGPSWAPDGQSILYIETREQEGRFPALNAPRTYTMQVPTLMRIAADGSGEPEALASGRFRSGSFTWFYWIRQPSLSSDGRTVAVVSDAPNPLERNVVVQLYDIETKAFTRPDIPETAPLGHQDPVWRPDGKVLLFTRNGRDGARGAPAIWRHTPSNGRSAALSGPGYLTPAWSRDLRWIAATRTTNVGTDVAILDARTGAEVFRVTDDDASWSPVWSPFGDAIAFLHQEGNIVDLRMVRLSGTGPDWQVAETINLTEVSALDGSSRPGWFVPAGELPPLPTPPPVTPSPSGSASPSASAAP